MSTYYIGNIQCDSDYLAHYGVPGMHWGKKKAKSNYLVRHKDAYNNHLHTLTENEKSGYDVNGVPFVQEQILSKRLAEDKRRPYAEDYNRDKSARSHAWQKSAADVKIDQGKGESNDQWYKRLSNAAFKKDAKSKHPQTPNASARQDIVSATRKTKRR